jgi:hypothetical protein
MIAAFTLLETLLTATLTVSVGIAALSLTTLQARLGTAARAQEEALALTTETARLIDDDLVLAVPHPELGRFQVLADGSLRLTTSASPAETLGLQEVLWRFDAQTGTVQRVSTRPGQAPTARLVGAGWRSFAVVLDHRTLWLAARHGETGPELRLPLWTDAP